MPAKPIPEGYHTVTPYLMVRDAQEEIEFLKNALGATESHPPMKRPDGKIMHAEMKIGDSRVMFGEANEQWPATTSSLYVYVPDADSAYKRAVQAGGKSTVEPTDQFYGDRSGCIADPSGNTWWLATHKEDLSLAELQKRGEEAFKKQMEKA
jgi:PhnB protein